MKAGSKCKFYLKHSLALFLCELRGPRASCVSRVVNFLVMLAKNYDAVNGKPLNKSCGFELAGISSFFLFLQRIGKNGSSPLASFLLKSTGRVAKICQSASGKRGVHVQATLKE